MLCNMDGNEKVCILIQTTEFSKHLTNHLRRLSHLLSLILRLGEWGTKIVALKNGYKHNSPVMLWMSSPCKALTRATGLRYPETMTACCILKLLFFFYIQGNTNVCLIRVTIKRLQQIMICLCIWVMFHKYNKSHNPALLFLSEYI